MIEKYTREEYQVARNPFLYYNFLDLVQSVNEEQVSKASEIRGKILAEIETLKAKEEIIGRAAKNFMEEARIATKKKNTSYSSLEQEDEDINKFHTESFNYIVIFSEIVSAISQIYDESLTLAKKLRIPSILTTGRRFESFDTPEALQSILQEIQLNGYVLENYAKSLDTLLQNTDLATKVGNNIYNGLEAYYKMLLHRHATQGMKIYKDPVITDIALRIFENIDSHGEIESGKTKDQISAYTIRKAEVLAKVLKDDMVSKFISNPDMLNTFVSDSLKNLEVLLNSLVQVYEPQIKKLYSMFGTDVHAEPNFKKRSVQHVLDQMNDVNPKNVSYQESKHIKNESERLIDKIQDETIEKIVEMILNPKTTFTEIVQYVLDRKAELRKFYHEENSFYVCKIGAGNAFTGQAPGALYIVPAEKPIGNINNILGSDFDEVREFAQTIESASKWHDLFKATSPSKKADKANVLLIGPQGCGKTEVMRGIGADKKSISIFAQGSDFNTCWKGEAEKNPKRLFEEGLKLTRDSGKHVHFLIDEIDELLNNDRGHGETNLTLEFQILMDGVVTYPNLSVWGATNNPSRIPMPMIRRFSKALVVGELSQDDRIKLMKMFLGRMPIEKDIKDLRWKDWSNKLEGATGDVVRKVADHIWRKKMNNFVREKSDVAETILKQLQAEGPFSVEKFDREKFKATLAPYVSISAEDIERSVKDTLSNMAIATEIKTAVQVYAGAKEFLKDLQD